MKLFLYSLFFISGYLAADEICSCTETTPPLRIGEIAPHSITSNDWVLMEFTTYETYNLFFGVRLPYFDSSINLTTQLVEKTENGLEVIASLERVDDSQFYEMLNPTFLDNEKSYAALIAFPDLNQSVEWPAFTADFNFRAIFADVSRISISNDLGDNWIPEESFNSLLEGAVIIKERPHVSIQFDESNAPLITSAGIVEYSINLIDWFDWSGANQTELLQSKNLFFRSTQSYSN